MRIIAGTAGGRMLKSFKGPGVRPTTDRVRESWFAMLGNRVIQARFLDLYAGTGAVGIEALSRGASRCVLVEKARRGVEVIRENLQVLESPGAAEVRLGDAVAAVRGMAGAGFDLVFADPPYEDMLAPARVLDALGSAQGILAAGGLVTIQHSRRVLLPERAGCLVRSGERVYGDTTLSMYGNGLA